MDALTIPCPHCLTPNPAWGAQRCASCGINMRSDQEQAILQERLKPLVSQLQEVISADQPQAAQIQPLLQQLAPYRDNFSFLEEVIQQTQQVLQPLQQAEYANRKRLIIHLLILLVLLIAPLLSSTWGAPLYLTALFMLPVLGWTCLGVWPLIRKNGL
ncbi:MAG: hypothetical protein AAFQ87_15790 [Bacteroidota bacterium]